MRAEPEEIKPEFRNPKSESNPNDEAGDAALELATGN
jgi:hypothetical protein